MDVNESEVTNVIEVEFNTSKRDFAEDIELPSSKNFPLEYDEDPLDSLLHEFDNAIDEQMDLEVYEDFIYHLADAKDVNLEMSQTASEMGDKVLGQVERLKEDFKRIKFYLDELNLDD